MQFWPKLAKLARILSRPSLIPALLRGTPAGVEHLGMLKRVQIGTLLDVGANRGQFSVLARWKFPDADIIAFEPLAEARVFYSRSVKRGSILMHACAVGAEKQRTIFHVTKRADSSSLFKPSDGPQHTSGVFETRSETVSVEKLPELVPLALCKKPIFMKTDVQGAELAVFQGCGADIAFIDFIYVELSFVPLYQNQPLASEVIGFLDQQGFDLRGVFNQTIIDGYGVAQADFLFARTNTRQRSSIALDA